MRRLTLLVPAIALAVVALDQFTKTWALDHLADGPHHLVWKAQLSLQFNTGIAFSQATGSTRLVEVIELAVVVGLLVAAWRVSTRFNAAVLGLIIGGASGNLVDRLVRHHGGAVIDWIDPHMWPVFNVADASVSIGVILAIVGSLVVERRQAAARGPG